MKARDEQAFLQVSIKWQNIKGPEPWEITEKVDGQFHPSDSNHGDFLSHPAAVFGAVSATEPVCFVASPQLCL